MKRKLASIRVIKEIIPIPNADSIEIAVIGGWKVVVSKGKHTPQEHVVYFEIDSFLPIRSEFEFLRGSSYKKMGEQEGFRIKTIKLRGQVSQGLIMSLDDLPEMKKCYANSIGYFWDEGEDVSELLGVVKYDPPMPPELNGVAKGEFPSFIPKTDEERIQNLSEVYNELSTKRYFMTEKLDGTSSTFFVNQNEFGVCSRNLELLPSDTNTLWKFAINNDIEDKLRELNRNIAIQGELIGEGIQGNRYKIKGQTVRFFKAFDIEEFKFLEYDEFVNLIRSMGCEVVPLLDNNFSLPENIDELITLSDGKSVLNPQSDREGVVFHSSDGTASFKIVSNKFLLKEKD